VRGLDVNMPGRIARDEALRDQDLAGSRQPVLQRRIRLEVTRRGQVVRAFGRALPLLGVQHGARIQPLHPDAFLCEVSRADSSGHQFADGHHPRAQPCADLTNQLDAGGALAQVREMTFEFDAKREAQVAHEIDVSSLDLLHDRLPLAGEGLRNQLLEAVGDARQSGMHDDRVQSFGQSLADDGRDVLPVADARDAGAAELEDDPV
jgi:hypothetical protein